MSEQESAQQQRIAELEEQLAEIRRQYDLLVRQIFGRKSEPQRPAGAEIDCDEGAARRVSLP